MSALNATEHHLLIDALNLQHGGGVIVMERVANAFVKAGYQVTILLSRNVPLGALDRRITLHVDSGVSGPVKSMFYRHTKLAPFCRKIGATDLLSFNYFTPSRLPQVTYHVNVIPFLSFSERRRAVGLIRALLQRRSACQALKLSTVNLFESHHLKDLADTMKMSPRNPDVVYTGIDMPPGSSARISAPDSSRIVLITSGAAHKRNDLAIEAFQHYRRHNAEAQLDILGNADAIRASLSEESRAFADSCPGIRFSGYLDRQNLYATLGGATALLTFSELESFYMVALEAMAVGCPVVAPDISSIRESVGEAGLLFQPGDVDAAVQCIVELEDPANWRELSKAGFERARNFSADRCAAEFVDVCRRKLHQTYPANRAPHG